MNETDKKIILNLINTYGIKELDTIIELYKELINYYNERDQFNSTKCYFENNTNQIITNGRSSVIHLNERIIDFEILKSKELKEIPKSVEKETIEEYIETGKRYLGDAIMKVSLSNDRGFIFYKNIKEETCQISLNEYKLIKLLLKNPIMYSSIRNSVIYFESEKGHAYVLTNNIDNHRGHLIF